MTYYIDSSDDIWKGPSNLDDTLHYARLEGFRLSGEPVWVLRRSEPDPSWRVVLESDADRKIADDAAKQIPKRKKGVPSRSEMYELLKARSIELQR